MITIAGILQLAAAALVAATMSAAAQADLQAQDRRRPSAGRTLGRDTPGRLHAARRGARRQGDRPQDRVDRGLRRLGVQARRMPRGDRIRPARIGDAHAPFEPAKMLAHNFAFFAPFGAPDPRVAAKAVREVYESTPALRKVLEDRYNQVFVAVGIVGNYGLITNFKWNTVADLKGHKIAAVGPNLRGCKAPAWSACSRR